MTNTKHIITEQLGSKSFLNTSDLLQAYPCYAEANGGVKHSTEKKEKKKAEAILSFSFIIFKQFFSRVWPVLLTIC